MSFIPFVNNENKKQERYADTQRSHEHDENLISSQTPDRGEDEQMLMERDEKRADLIKWQQDLSDEALRFVMEIRGFYINEDDEWVRDIGTKPLADEEFIRRVRPLLIPSISRNLIMTNYSEERVLRSLRRAASEFTWILFTQGKEFNIRMDDYSTLVASFKAVIEPTYYRALLNGERKYLTTINKRVETFSDRPESKKRTLFNIGV